MFRLISSRIGEIISFTSCAFFVLDEQNKFYVPFATGKNSRLLESLRIECSDGLAGKSFLSCQIERDKNLTFDKRGITREFLSGLASAMAVPLLKDDEVFCVLVIYSDVRDNYRANDEKLLEAIGERIAPLIIGSYSFEKNLSNAMTDSITSLPNERAFYMMLESRVAEAQRFQEQQNLTVLAIDIKNFAEINEKYGHAAGDRMLVFAAKTIQYQLRRMDLVARMNKDEFLVVLPTANDIITDRIVERIESSFLDAPFAVTEDQKIYIELCFGSATFQDDGDTAEKLMNTALIRKHQSKSNGQNSVVFFPKQYVN
jgi:diguanylate cyclase (GGDEF)-like protein